MKGTESIDLHFDLPENAADIWRALTEPALLEAWLMPNDIKPVVGHHFTYRNKPIGDWDGIAYCEVTEVVPEEKLQYAWRSKKDPVTGEYNMDTLLTFTLSSNPQGGTHMHLLHEGFEAGDFALHAMGQGWASKTVSRIGAVLRGEALESRC
ncbi:MAG TPA: SRPBCC domain-containing protein [Acidobacteriaceae bacterium]|jgi:uncharacterized protein YndB with AHSA1/START domain